MYQQLQRPPEGGPRNPRGVRDLKPYPVHGRGAGPHPAHCRHGHLQLVSHVTVLRKRQGRSVLKPVPTPGLSRAGLFQLFPHGKRKARGKSDGPICSGITVTVKRPVSASAHMFLRLSSHPSLLRVISGPHRRDHFSTGLPPPLPAPVRVPSTLGPLSQALTHLGVSPSISYPSPKLLPPEPQGLRSWMTDLASHLLSFSFCISSTWMETLLSVPWPLGMTLTVIDYLPSDYPTIVNSQTSHHYSKSLELEVPFSPPSLPLIP